MSEHHVNTPPTSNSWSEIQRRLKMASNDSAPSDRPTIRRHFTAEQSMTVAKEAIEQAEQHGKWMVAVWSVVDGKLQLRRVTWDFPLNDFAEAMRQLKVSLDEETKLPNTDPLPKADLK